MQAVRPIFLRKKDSYQGTAQSTTLAFQFQLGWFGLNKGKRQSELNRRCIVSGSSEKRYMKPIRP